MNKKRRNVCKGLITVIALCFLLCLIPAKTEAASAKQKAMKAYKKFLTQESIPWSVYNYDETADPSLCKFSLVYLDNNSVPELVVSGGDTYYKPYMTIYTYKNGKVTLVENSSYGFSSYYKKKGIIVESAAKGATFYNKYSNGQLKIVLAKLNENAQGRDLNGDGKIGYAYYKTTSSGDIKYISKSSFNKRLKKLVGSKNTKKLKFYKNTAKNRKKYLK
ncbi:MAG: hypothetical protein LUF92_09805 [Clostridiales bacterium]|nr:hypothetical protein [Clostridiales bacterium]